MGDEHELLDPDQGAPRCPPPRIYPKSPMPAQTQEKPGLESEMTPRPDYKAPALQGLGQACRQGRADHRRRLGHRPGRGRALRPRGGRRGDRLPAGRAVRRRGDASRPSRREGRKCLLLPGDVTDPAFCREAVERTVARVRPARHPGQQRRLPAEPAAAWRTSATSSGTGPSGRTSTATSTWPGRPCRTCRRAAPSSTAARSPGMQGSKNLLDYAATKGAIHAFTKSLAQNLVERKHPRQLRGPGPDLDAAAAGRQAGREGRRARRRRRRWAARASPRRSRRPSSSSPRRPTPATSPARC